MAVEVILQHDGTQLSGGDYRNSTLSGSTLGGPSGSGQFLAVRQSTAADRTVLLTTATGQPIYGILQNKPGVGDAADVGVYGTSKVVSASTAIGAGMDLMVSSTTFGAMIPYSSASTQARVARATEAAGAVGQIFSAFLYGGVPSGSIA